MQQPKSAIKQIGILQKLGYSMGNYSYGIVSQMIGFYIVFYGTSVLGISGKMVGIAVGISVIWDALTDPVMGYVSDHTHHNIFGRRHLYILIGCIFMSLFTYLLFNIQPDWGNGTKIVLLISLLILVKTCITIYTTPYTALGAELSTDYTERTSIQGLRTMFFLTGIISATGMGLAIFFNPTENYPNGQLNPESYSNMGLAVALLALLFGLTCFFATFKNTTFSQSPVKQDGKKGIKQIFHSMKEALENKYYRNVVLAYLFTNISSGIFGTLGLHVYTYTFRFNNTQIATILGMQFLFCALSQPIWVMISKKIDKKPTAILGLSISIVGSVLFGILVLFKSNIAGNVFAIIPFAVITGFGIAGLFSLPLSMIADTIDVEELESGKRSEGVYYGLLTLAYKLSQGFVIFLLGFILDIVEFIPDSPIQPSNTESVLGLTVSIGSIIGFLLGLYFYAKYRLNHKKVFEIQEIIKNRKLVIAQKTAEHIQEEA
ncbi:MAG: hypothetical protein CVV02_09290 [Firmicutes bacterium HGW-Firmicutes-7]|nr:MAG: hypothetical protein CVV02_09290 [Firmicutes bacterium HGW-Firmicutes-7]